MTISTTASATTVYGNGATYTFNFSFVANSAADISVAYTNASGGITPLTPTQYTLFINAPASNQIWGIGGTITYPLSGSPIAAGTSLTITRVVPLTQTTSISNQGDFSPQVIEQALDTLCQEIQQVSARTGQMRGVWQTGISYNYGDIVQDGINGAFTNNFYTCAIANTSGVWATDLANGDWSLSVNVQQLNNIIGAYLPLTGGTVNGNVTVTGTTTTSALAATTSATVPTRTAGDSTTNAASTAFVTGAAATALQKSANLSDLGSLATALTNLGFASTFGSGLFSVTFPGGFVLKGGVTGSLSTGNTAVSFAVAFPTSCFSVIVQLTSNGSTGVGVVSAGSVSRTGFSIQNNSGNGQAFYFIAAGN